MTDISSLEIDVASFEKALSTVDLSTAGRPVCEDYAYIFFQSAEVATEVAPALQLLAYICVWRLNPDDPELPIDELSHQERMSGLSTAQLDVFESRAEFTTDPDIRARLCDLLWLKKRGHAHARLAVDAYFASADRLLSARMFSQYKTRLRRSLQLAALLGRSQEVFVKVSDRTTEIAERDSLLHCELALTLEALLESGAGNVSRMHFLAERRAIAISSSDPNPSWERRFWELAARFAQAAKDPNLNRSAMLRVAKTYENQALQAQQQVIAAGLWASALKTYRDISGTEDERQRVHSELLKSQVHIPNELFSFTSEPIDITHSVTVARQRIHGKDIARAIAEFVFAVPLPEKAKLQADAVNAIRQFPLQHMFPTTKLSGTGKFAAKTSGVGPGSEDVSDEKINAEMCHHLKFLIAFNVASTVEPMRQELLLFHLVTRADINQFVQGCPFIPNDRVSLFVAGLLAGLKGDFVVCLHILIPQLEYVLREIMSAKGIIVSKVDQNAIQDEFDLNRIFSMAESKLLLGEDLQFVLKAILTDRRGYNLRNELAHGMVSERVFSSEIASYTAWLLLRIVGGNHAASIIDSDPICDRHG